MSDQHLGRAIELALVTFMFIFYTDSHGQKRLGAISLYVARSV